jgi:hypothetical protein
MIVSPPPYQHIAPDVKLGKGVCIYGFTNLYGCEMGNNAKVGTFVEIQKGSKSATAARSPAIHSSVRA